jgi:hypothetical protein
MSNEPVKTTLLKAIETLLRGIPELVTVGRWQDIPTDLEPPDPLTGAPRVLTPALFFWDEPEDLQAANRTARNVLHLNLAVFIRFTGEVNNLDSPAYQTFTDQAEVIAGRIHALWYDPAALAPLRAAGLLQVEEGANRKTMASELYGEMVLTARLIYGHRLGDAFTIALS